MFAPTLRQALFHKADHEGGGDMVDKIAEAADLRFPEIEKPLRWTKEIVGAELVIDHGLIELFIEDDALLAEVREGEPAPRVVAYFETHYTDPGTSIEFKGYR